MARLQTALTVKEDGPSGWRLLAKTYDDGGVRLVLESLADRREYGDFPGMTLNDSEWRRLVSWAAFQRAELEVRAKA